MPIEEILKGIAIVATPFIVGAVKRLGLRGTAAAWFGFVASAAVATAVSLLGQQPSFVTDDPVVTVGALLAFAGTIYTYSTLLYNSFKDKLFLLDGGTKIRFMKANALLPRG